MVIESLLVHEPWIRGLSFGGVFVAVMAIEFAAPRRVLSVPRRLRWGNNIAIALLNSLMLRWLFPAAGVGAAWLAAKHGIGVLNWLNMPALAALAIAFVVLDLAIWIQHRLMHAVPLLWRLHRVHHTDLDFDWTTGARFHPLEILLSFLYKSAVIILLGAPAVAVVLFEVLLNANSMFNHGNFRLPALVDWWLRWVLVTPDMHRIHHSILGAEVQSNFGFQLTWWDRLFGTYRANPRDAHETMLLGLAELRTPVQTARLWSLIAMPFKNSTQAGSPRDK